MDKFSGKLLHSAEWDPSLDLKNKRVFVVGTGASSIQITPTVAPQVKELRVFQRTPAWVPSRYIRGFPKKKDFDNFDLNIFFPQAQSTPYQALPERAVRLPVAS